MVGDATWFTETPAGFRARDVVVRPARPDEWRRWDGLVDRHHLGFRRFAGHGPANSATLNVLAIAVIKRWMATHKALAPITIAGMRRRLSHNRHEALEAMLGPAHA